MEDVKFKGRIFASEYGAESTLIIPVGEYSIMIISDDSCGVGKGKIIRNELRVYKEVGTDSYNQKIFGYETVTADSETLFEAMQFCQRELRKKLKMK
jgi:hypothetical protein